MTAISVIHAAWVAFTIDKAATLGIGIGYVLAVILLAGKKMLVLVEPRG
jgi:hypothetical protein